MEGKIIVALDAMTRGQALELAGRLKGNVWGFKVNDLLLDCGLSIVKELKEFGGVFADPKLHDIPNTVGNSVRKLSSVGADLITVHASGGRRMMEEAAKASDGAEILAVTVLTSLSDDEASESYQGISQELVPKFAMMAADSGVHGIVCSPKELSLLGSIEKLGSLKKVTPGVRPAWYGKKDDQSRVTTPSQAVSMGASYLVVGRPITGHDDPAEAASLINEELAKI